MKTILPFLFLLSFACGCGSSEPDATTLRYQELQRSFNELQEMNNTLQEKLESTVKELSATSFTLGYYKGWSGGINRDFRLQEDSAKYVSDIYTIWK